MKLLLINPLLPHNMGRSYALPIGFLALHAWLTRHGHEVDILQPQYKMWGFEQMLDYVKETKPDVVGMGGFFEWLGDAATLSKMIREHLPHVRLLFGGYMASPNPELCFKLAPIDWVCRGEGEIATQKLLDGLARGEEPENVPGIGYMKDGQYVDNGFGEHPDLDEIPLYDYEQVNLAHHCYNLEKNPMSPYYAPIGHFVTGRGCPFRCNFCFSVQKFRRESMASLERRLDHFVKRVQPKSVLFYDDTFCFNEAWVEEICDLFVRKKYGFKFTCTARPNLFTRRMARALKKAGCYRAHFALEVADDAILKNMNKQITVDQWSAAVALSKEEGIMPNISAMAGQPFETWDTVARTAELIANVPDPQYPYASIGFFVLRIYPGSPLYNQAMADGYFKDDLEFYENFNKNNPIWLSDLDRPTLGRVVQKVNEGVIRIAHRYMSGKRTHTPVSVHIDDGVLVMENA